MTGTHITKVLPLSDTILPYIEVYERIFPPHPYLLLGFFVTPAFAVKGLGLPVVLVFFSAIILNILIVNHLLFISHYPNTVRGLMQIGLPLL